MHITDKKNLVIFQKQSSRLRIIHKPKTSVQIKTAKEPVNSLNNNIPFLLG